MKEEVRILISCLNPKCGKKWYKIVEVIESESGVDSFVENCTNCDQPIKVRLEKGYVLAVDSNNSKDVYRGK